MSSPKWRVLLLDTKPGNINHYIVLGIEGALRTDPRVESVHYADYADALPTAIQNDCNLFIAFDGEELDRGLCRRIAAVCGRSVLWVTDDPYVRESDNLKNAEVFDLVFTNDSGSVRHYEGKARHLPFAANPRFNFQEIPARDQSHYLHDVLFVGTAWPNRVRFLRELMRELPDIKFKVALPSNEHLPTPDPGLPRSVFSWRVPNSEMCRLANRSRIVLGLHRAFGPVANCAESQTPGPRLYEIALAGGFQLIDLSLRETVEYFSLGNEIAGFSNLRECRDQIRYFLRHADLRMNMARAAQTRCFAEHLYQHRIGTILDAVDSIHTKPLRVEPSRSLNPAKKYRILFVSHNAVNQEPFGGVEVYVDLLARNLPEVFEPYLYYPDRRLLTGSGVVCENVRTGSKTHHRFSTPTNSGNVTDFERENHFAEVLQQLQIDLVHFQHLILHPWSLPLVARTMGLPVVMSLADHYAVCENFTLLNASRQFCDIPRRPTASCDVCLHKVKGAAAGSAASRRTFVGSVLENTDLTIFLCESARDIARSLFPSALEDDRVWVEGFPLDDRQGLPRAKSMGNCLKVVVVGNFDVHKGADMLCDIFHAMREDPVEFHVHGDVREPYLGLLRSGAFPQVRVHGSYQPHTLRGPLSDADMGLFLSNWPETYVLTLSEVWRAGVVPIVTDIGALGERVRDGINGFKVPVNDAGGVVHTLRGMIADPNSLERMRSNIDPSLYCTLEGHIERLTQKYDELLTRYRVPSRKEWVFSDRVRPRAASADNVFRMHPHWFTPAVTAQSSPADAEALAAARLAVGEPQSAVGMTQPSGPLIGRVYRFWRANGFKATVRCSAAELRQRLAR